ncbi:hypothetical protein GSI_11944 [Ganoderma sinense ZZ0214-1]|uniref:Transporter n=1 Tax=Ganoderma sinense ZZ0214-1 TaxID=1077348 RepID=A0A2G8RXE3_9APHY|nr:hypothetical protein GSI_11944 [Ganoderma sinense ZZ0214-1]
MAVNFKSRTFRVPGIVFLFLSFILLFIVSISLPYLTDLDVVRVHFKDSLPTVGNDTNPITAVRFGTWAACWYQQNGDRVCNTNHGGYSTTLHDPQRMSSETIAASWTRGLAIHPIAAAVTLVALGLSFLTHASARLAAALVAFLAAFLTLLAFLAEIALYGWVKQRVDKLNGVGSETAIGPGFWITFVVLMLLSLSGCTVCVGRRRDRLDDAQKYPYSWKAGAPRRVPPAPAPFPAAGTRRVPPAFGSPAPGGRPTISAPMIPGMTAGEVEKEKEAEAEREREEMETEAEMRMVPPQLPPRSASTNRPVPPPPPPGLGAKAQ